MAKVDHQHHTPDAEGIEKIQRLRTGAIELEACFDEVVPPSRELSIAKTKLEEARMWAIKGLVMPYPATTD